MSTAPKVVRTHSVSVDTTSSSRWMKTMTSTQPTEVGFSTEVDPRNRKERRKSECKEKGPIAKYKHNRIYIP